MIDHVAEFLAAQKVGRGLVEIRVDDGLHPARTRRHHHHALGEIDRLLHVMGDENHCLGRGAPDAQQLALHERAGLRVERAEGLVHQQNAGVDGERARDGGALLHAARQLRGIVVLESMQPDEIDELAGARLALVARHVLALQTVKHVLQNGFPWEQREMLEHDATIGPRPRDRLAINRDGSRFDRQESAHQVKQRRFSAAGGSEQRDEFLLIDLKRDIL